tara:strand:- start:465 stop:1019 length:555 start_codon:yes stop_codon:yes gene_type:complete
MKKMSKVVYLVYILFVCILDADVKENSIYSLGANLIDGTYINMSEYKGKKILIVNVASRCGYTYQYEGLQSLYKKYNHELVILGFPSNQFLWQEPATNSEIQKFCKINYDVSFPMFEKIKVRGKNKHSIYMWLANSDLNGWNNKEPNWNFYKYLIDESGRLIKVFDQTIEPEDTLITKYFSNIK